MNIEQIKLSNFRCFGDSEPAVTLEQNLTCLLGNNGSGKTALIIALKRLFGSTKEDRTITRDGFHIGFNEDSKCINGRELYKEIIFSFTELKKDVQKAFDKLQELMEALSTEETRAMEEGLDEETLAIFDLLRKPELSKKEEEKVKKVAIKTLSILKEEKLKIERWRESTQVAAQVKIIISDNLQWLPQESYNNNEVNELADHVYQHIYSTYSGYGISHTQGVGI